MTTLHATSVYNVRGSVNSWFATKAATLTLPASVTYTLIVQWPETDMPVPSIALTHADVSRTKDAMGRVVGGGYGGSAAGLLDISAFVSRNNRNWQAQLSALQSVIEAVFAGTGAIGIKDYLTTPNAPTTTVYGVRFGSLDMGETMPFAGNPDIMRSRSLIRYDWTLRTNVT